MVLTASPATLKRAADRARLIALLADMPGPDNAPGQDDAPGQDNAPGQAGRQATTDHLAGGQAETADQVGQVLHIEGALTAGRLGAIPADCRAVVLDDFTRVFVGFRQMATLARRCRVSFARQFDLLAMVVNLFDVTVNDLAEVLPAEVMKRVVINPYMEPAPC